MNSFTVLIDNNPNPEKKLFTEHGLSIYIETQKQKLLLDTGNSPLFIDNAKKLGINLSNINYVILSHAHKDHTGGLREFLKINKKAIIFASAHIKGKSFYSNKKGNNRDISIDYSLFNEYPDRFQFIDHNGYITNNVALITHYKDTYPLPKANQHLFIEENNNLTPDTFKHEMALTINTPQGLVVISGCAHKGILNILQASSSFWKKEVTSYIGGTHLPDAAEPYQYETDKEIEMITEELRVKWPKMKLFTGHCTGKKAIKQFEKAKYLNALFFYSGFTENLS